MNWIVIALTTGAMALALFDLLDVPAADDDAPARIVDDVTSAATLEFWSRIYTANHFCARITFQQFMSNPRGYLSALLFAPDLDDAIEALPLLPEQERVREQLLLDEAAEVARQRKAEHEEALRRVQLQLAYSQISTNGNRPGAPLRRLPPKSRGATPHLA
jgi:hypothetical protein